MCFLSKIFIISQVGDPVYNFDEENTSSPYEGPNPLPDMLARLVAKKAKCEASRSEVAANAR